MVYYGCSLVCTYIHTYVHMYVCMCVSVLYKQTPYLTDYSVYCTTLVYIRTPRTWSSVSPELCRCSAQETVFPAVDGTQPLLCSSPTSKSAQWDEKQSILYSMYVPTCVACVQVRNCRDIAHRGWCSTLGWRLCWHYCSYQMVLLQRSRFALSELL